MEDSRQAIEEIETIMKQLSEKHFISTFVVAISIRDQSGNVTSSIYDGSFAEAIGLCETTKIDLLNDHTNRQKEY